ncbi:MAG: hypothetical protein OXI95_16135 [bacterium]|nr:hypothetical protein [bacterium]
MKMLVIAALALVAAPFLPALAQTVQDPAAAAPPEISFSQWHYSGCEGSRVTLTVEKDGDGEAAVDYATVDADSPNPNAVATVGVDYVRTSGSLHFAPGDTEKTITVKTIADADVTESAEVFLVKLSLGSGGDAADGSATLVSPSLSAVTILNAGTSC